LADGTWYVFLYDSLGATNYTSATIGCYVAPTATPTPTPVPTDTPTPTPLPPTATPTPTSTPTPTPTPSTYASTLGFSKLTCTTGNVVLYQSSDNVSFYQIASRTTNGTTNVNLNMGWYYYITTTRSTCTCTGSPGCGSAVPQTDWTVDGVTYGPNVGSGSNYSSVDSDVIQTATSGTHSYSFNGYLQYGV